ncbi:MAG: molybdenum cofactor guanylyltransferase [Deltaproteobacteria bacterium]|nr:molybdenum cofactor guanylyltransferase [Deltaproteobacteria bacterium]
MEGYLDRTDQGRCGDLPIPAPGLLLVGAAGRNAGKTEFACRVLERVTGAGARPVAAAKVTTVQEADGICPRGGEGCGACATLESDWCISEELDRSGPKDTSRLLRAGGSRVFWLRVLEGSLLAGAQKLQSQVGPSRPWVCESNRLRRALDPDLFVLVREAGSGPLKPSAASVAGLADAVVVSDGRTFEPEPNAVSLLDGVWTMRRDATAIVLAGGRSTRMGTDKSLLDLSGRPLIAHVVDQVRPQASRVLLSAPTCERFSFLGLPVALDRIAGAGPLAAVASALEDSTTDWNLVVPCDMPRVPARLVTQMFRMREGVDAVVPTSGRHFEPLFALYRKSCLPAMRKMVLGGGRKIIDVFRQIAVRTLPLPDDVRLLNINTPEDFRDFGGRG